MRLVGWAAVACLAAVTGCGDVPGAGMRRVAEFEYWRAGGLCPTDDGGATCEIRVIVRDDGTWSATGVPEPPSEGTLPLGAASALTTVFQNAWRDLTEVPFTGTCPTAFDGQEYGYVVREIPIGPGAERADARVREVRTCWYDLERYDGLMRRNQIETAWIALKPPELDHVEFR